MADYDRAGTDRPSTFGDLADSPIFDRTSPPADPTPTNTGGGGLAQLTPWTENINAAAFNLTNVGVLGIGVSSPASGTKIADFSKALGTFSAGEHIIGIEFTPTGTWQTSGGGSYVGWHITPQLTVNANMGEIVGIQSQPAYTGTGTITQAHAQETLLSIGAPTTLARGNWMQIGVSLGTTALAIGADIEGYKNSLLGTFTEYRGIRIRTGIQDTGTIGTVIGIDMTALNSGTTKWAMQIGDYQSYHVGKMTFGLSQAPTYAVDIKGATQDRGVLAFAQSSATPTAPIQANQMLVYMKGDKFVINYRDSGGTIRYKYLDLTGVGVTWVHSTTAP